MSSPIIRELPGGMKCQVWHECVLIARTGSKPLVVGGKVHDKWCIQIPLAASLVDANEQLIVPEIVTKAPMNNIVVDAADLLHDPRIAQAFALIDAVATDLVTGDLKPIPSPELPSE